MDFSSLPEDLREACVNTIRFLAIDAVEKAQSGHPGLPMGAADMAFVLWSRFLKVDPSDPEWISRDRFILSAGHGSMLLYALLHLSGFELSLDDLKDFRQWGAKTAGHPEYGYAPGVEVTTGPLGQGFAHGVGMALAERHLGAQLNTADFSPIDSTIWGIVSDGDLMEGISAEAASLAGHLGLGNIVYLYDSNRITIDGSTDLTFSEDVRLRFESMGWHVLEVNGHDHEEVAAALAAGKNEKDKPTLIIARTTIGYGSPGKADSSSSHGAPLGEKEVALTRQNLGWPEETFHVPQKVREVFAALKEQNLKARKEWNEGFAAWRTANAEKAQTWDSLFSAELPENLEEELLKAAGDDGAATRVTAGKVLGRAAELIPSIVGGSADLDGSTNTRLKPWLAMQKGDYAGRNIHYGIREHAMAAVANGLVLFGGLRAFTATFLVFSDYMRPGIRLAALMKVPTVFVFTHDSVFLGEDGPTHQPIEHVSSLRAIPNVEVWRPGNARECALAWAAALRRTDGPTVLVLTRQKLPALGGKGEIVPQNADQAAAWLAHEPEGKLDAVLLATGSEAPLAVAAAKALEAEGSNLRVVSMPCPDRFLERSKQEQDALLPPGVPVASVEAGRTDYWYRLVGRDGLAVGLDDFGFSAPAEVIAEKIGFTPPLLAARLKEWLGQKKA